MPIRCVRWLLPLRPIDGVMPVVRDEAHLRVVPIIGVQRGRARAARTTGTTPTTGIFGITSMTPRTGIK